ncbi:MAG: A/G-specific adenine glycosylase [Micrococcaceae bacterium]
MALHKIIIDWYTHNQRDLPWRKSDCTPWGILVSEVMLQQTPVVRVLPRWEAWMARWPTPEACAQASKSDILKMWDRLGYPRRALRLHAAAQAITTQGFFPANYQELRELPGVGDYTASAVSCFAFKNKEVVIDTNIRRVQARAITGTALPAPTLNASEKKLAAQLLPQQRLKSVQWNAAIMELGALVCTAKAPSCHQCPIHHECQWIKAGRPEAQYQPRGQTWQGTDRQVRGAIMAILRHASKEIPEELLTGPIVNTNYAEEEVQQHLAKLKKLQAPQKQRQKAVETLLQDGLASSYKQGLSLPQ